MASTEKPPSRQLTTRDLACLNWTALQYALRLDQLQRLLYRHTPEEDRYKLKPDTDTISLDRTYELINKWLLLGLIEKKTILHGDKLWIWLTREGLRTVNLDFNYSGAPSSVRLPHLYFINQVRLAIEAKRPGDLWTSERQIRKGTPPVEKGQHQPHTPDALLTSMTNGKITAIEVECHAKTERDLEDDLRELATTYRSVWYFTTPATRRQVEAMLDTFGDSMKKPFLLYDLADYDGGGHEYKLP